MALAVIQGNWVGAAIVALATAFTTGFLGLCLALLAKPTDFGLMNTLTFATVIAAGAFGADLRMEGSTTSGGDSFLDLSGDLSLGVFPLTVTLAALAVGIVVFRRVTAGYPSSWAAAGDAVRAALLFGIFLAVPALVLTADNDELGRGWGRELSSDAFGYDVDLGSHAAGAFALGFLVLVTALLLTSAVGSRKAADGFVGAAHSDQARAWETARNLARPVVSGLVVLAVLLPVAGAIGLVALMFGEDSADEVTGEGTRVAVALIAAGLANGGVWLLALGAGAPVGGKLSATGEPSEEEFSRLWGDITQQEPGLWVAPVVLVAVLALATVVVLRRAREQRPFLTLGAWLATLLLVVPLLVRLASVHVSASLESESETYSFSAVAGPDGAQTTLLILLVAILVAAVLGLWQGLYTLDQVKGVARRAGATVQRDPSARGSAQSGGTADAETRGRSGPAHPGSP